MTDNSAPGVYTQPDGDADDVLGHRFIANDKKADRIAQNDEPTDDDVEGHKKADRQVADDGDDVEGHRAAFERQDRQVADDDDDVEGHKKADRQVADDGDDVEGHKKADRLGAHDEDDDVEGHKKA